MRGSDLRDLLQDFLRNKKAVAARMKVLRRIHINHTFLKMRGAAEQLALLSHVRVVPGLNLGPKTCCRE
jgi:hypothetical protein